MYDFDPAAHAVAWLLPQITDDQLTAPTPCPDYLVRDLLFHVLGLSVAFRDAGRKDLGPMTSTPPGRMKTALPDDWRIQIPRRLDELAAAWRKPQAWDGQTQVGGLTLPAAVAGLVGLNELLVHGWDIARGTGATYAPAEASVRTSFDLMSGSQDWAQRAPMFGPVFPVPADAPLLDRVIGLSGRDPSWRPSERQPGSTRPCDGLTGDADPLS